MISSAARFRNPPPGPPNDPTWMLLEGRNGWPVAPASSGIATSPLDCALVLQNAPGGAASLADPSGRFGGLVPPPNVALAQDGAVWLLDVKRGRLRRFDSCACAFVDVPHTGGSGDGARRFVSPIAIAVRGRDLLVLDAGAASRPGRVLAFARHGFALRAVWAPPRAATPSPWRPTAFAVTPDGRTLVADAANGACARVRSGGNLARVMGRVSGRSPRWPSTGSAGSTLWRQEPIRSGFPAPTEVKSRPRATSRWCATASRN